MSLSKLNMGELRQRLSCHGEVAPKTWSRSQLILRLTELEGMEALKVQAEKSPLRQLEVQLNKASRRKSELQQMVANMGVTVTGNETIQVLLLKGLDMAAKVSPGHSQDHLGFGKHSNKMYGEVASTDPGYCTWVKETAREGSTCPRLQRFATWLEAQKEDVSMIPAQQGVSAKTKDQRMVKNVNKEVVTTNTAGSSSSEEPGTQQVLIQVMSTVKTLASDLEEMKRETKESKRRTNYSEDVTTSNSEWEGVSSA